MFPNQIGERIPNLYSTSEGKLFEYFVNSTFWKLSVTGKQYKGVVGGWLTIAREVAVEKMVGLTFSHDIKMRKTFTSVFVIGRISAERPDSDDEVGQDFKVSEDGSSIYKP